MQKKSVFCAKLLNKGGDNMPITCKKLLSLSFLDRNMVLKGGSKGLDRIIRWFHALEGVDEIQFLQNNELVFMTGISIGNDKNKILQMLKGIDEKQGAGLVINTGKYIMDIPQEVITYADKHMIPIFSVPWDIRLGNVTRKIGELILAERSKYKNVQGLVKKILFSEHNSVEKMFDMALLDDYDLLPQKQIMLLEFSAKQLRNIEEYQERLMLLFQEIMLKYDEPCLFTWNGSEAVFIISEYNKEKNFPADLKHVLHDELALDVFIGIGGSYEKFSELQQSHKEAHFTLNLARKDNSADYILYKDTNIFRVFDKVNDLNFIQKYYTEVLGELLHYDEKNNSEFTRTLEVYLEENEDVATTIKRLFIHRNTLTYRLKRIEEIMQCSMENSEMRLNFRIAFKMKTFLSFMQN